MANTEYKILRSSLELGDKDLFWAVVDPMWNALDFYEEPERVTKFFDQSHSLKAR